ncbi:uncharacterized protein [Asterias amurensis]|uniref:uncharacterized protein isoform X1 n=1 Tax=Asterias amurensis TaxID=7602 RepID=UPI003AB17D3F
MSDVNPGAQRINELIRNYDPPQSNETDPTCECVAERIAMVMKMHTPEEQVVIANSIASRIMKAGEVDVPSGVDHKKHASIYTCHEDDRVTMVTDNKEEEDGGRSHAQKREASQVWEEPSKLVSDETSPIVSVSHHLETTKEDERKKTNGQEEVKTKGEIYKEMKIKVIKIEKVVEVESIVEEYFQQKEQKEESCAKVEMVKGKEGELKMMYQFKEEAKVDHEMTDRVEEMRTEETRAELGDANGSEVEGMGDNSKGEEQVAPKKIGEPVQDANTNEIKSEVVKRRDGEIGEMGEVGSKVKEEVGHNEPVEGVTMKEEWNIEDQRKDEVVVEMKFKNQPMGDGDAAANWATEEGEILEQEEDEEELTSWSSISDLDTVSLLTSISSLSFGEIISVSGEDDGELTADEIGDEVWDDYVNGDIEDEIKDEASITSKIFILDGDDTALQSADDQTDLISICSIGQGHTEVGSTSRRGFWSRIFGRRQSKRDRKMKKISVEQGIKTKKYSKMAGIMFACCCVQPLD